MYVEVAYMCMNSHLVWIPPKLRHLSVEVREEWEIAGEVALSQMLSIIIELRQSDLYLFIRPHQTQLGHSKSYNLELLLQGLLH